MAKKFWIAGAIKHPGALRRSAKRSEIGKGGKLKLGKMMARAKKTGNTTMMRRINLARTLGKMHRRH